MSRAARVFGPPRSRERKTVSHRVTSCSSDEPAPDAITMRLVFDELCERNDVMMILTAVVVDGTSAKCGLRPAWLRDGCHR